MNKIVDNSKQNTTSPTMADLMANYDAKPLKLSRGDQVSGEIISITDSEIIIDLGVKTEGVLNKKDLPEQTAQTIKIGDKLSAYVVIPENESGQLILSNFKPEQVSFKNTGRGGKNLADQIKKWQKFIQAKNNNSVLSGKVTEVNKGGLVVEIDGVRGFLPSSQIGFDQMKALVGAGGLSGLIGQDLSLSVIEVEASNNRLIFSNRVKVTDELKETLAKFTPGQKVTGKLVAIVPFGLFVELGDPSTGLRTGCEGVVFLQEISWDPALSKIPEGREVEELSKDFQIGQELEVVVLDKDENLGRVSLSLRQNTKDPFTEAAQKFEVDDVVKGTIKEVTQNGVLVNLTEGVEGLIPASKIESGINYTPGQEIQALVDGVDLSKRRINLAPFLTSTKGLIYK